jgi:hypothetical protein
MRSNREKEAEVIISQEVNNVSMGSNEVKQNGCAACHVLFTLVDKMQLSDETEAADLLTEILLSNPHLNDRFIEMVENIHMKQRLMGGGFSIKTREAKDRFIDSKLKTVLAEFSADLVNYGLDIVLRKLLMSSISLEIAQTIGVDYHAASEELYYYMRKKDQETHAQITDSINRFCQKANRSKI